MNETANRPAILVVDDSSAVRSYVANLLAADGCQITEASDGEKCLHLLEEEIPDVVILDVEMPVKSGLEVLAEIGLKPRLFSIILCTTRSSREQIEEGFDLGADDYMVKPFSESDLRARVRAAVRTAWARKAQAQALQETEKALARLQALQSRLVEEEKVVAVARLAAGAAHHINNPLGFVMSNLSTLQRYATSIMLFADLLAEELRAQGEEARVRELEQAQRIRQIRTDLPPLLQETKEGGHRIALIVQQLAQLELGFMNQEYAELDLVALLTPLIGIAEGLAPTGTTVRWVHPKEEVFIRGSVSLINTALLAVLKNACEALGSVAGIVSVELVMAGETARITISDSGPGVSSTAASSLFDPFFSTKSPESHVGLGLTIARAFISAQRGTIAVYPLLHGSSVEMEFPLLSHLK